MSVDLERLNVLLEVQAKQFDNAIRRQNASASRLFKQIEDRASRMEASVGRSFDRMGLLISASTSAISTALSANKLREYADAWQDMANKIAASSEKIQSVPQVQNRVADIAIASRSDLGSTGQLYAGLTRATDELGASQAQVLRVVETVNKSFVVGGASAQEAASGVLQLNQALGSGVLQGDELRSIRENAPLIAKAIATEFGVTIGELKKLGEEGKLTADRVFKALLNASKDIDAQFAKTSATVSQSFTNLNTALTRYFGQVDQAGGYSRALAGAIQLAADNADIFAKSLAILGVGLSVAFAPLLGLGAVAGGIAAATTAVALFGEQIHPIAGDIASLADYARIGFEAIAQLSREAAQVVAERFARAADLVTEALNAIGGDGSLQRLVEAVKLTVNQIIGIFAFCATQVATVWSGIGPALTEVTINAMNAVIAAVEAGLKRIISAINAAFGSLGAPQIPEPDFGRIANVAEGAGKATAQAFGENFKLLTRDYIGDAVGSAADALNGIRDRANRAAMDRARRNFRAGEAASQADFGSLSQPLRASKSADNKGGGGGKSEADKAEDRINRYIDSLRRQNDVLKAEIDTVGKSNIEKRAAVELARAGVDLNRLDAQTRAQLVGTLQKEITLSEELRTKKKALEDAQKGLQDAQKLFGESVVDGLEGIIFNGERAEDVLKNLVKQLAKAALQAALLGQGPLAGFFGTSGSNGNLGGLFGMLFKGFADGGYTGNGGRNEPKGLVHGGEYVFDKQAVKAAGGPQALEALRRRLKGYANGGYVGPSVPAGIGARGGGGLKVVVNNMASDRVAATAEQRPDGSLQLVIDAIKGDIAQDLLRGQGAISTAFGARQSGHHLRG